jgi:dihydropyrimidinase
VPNADTILIKNGTIVSDKSISKQNILVRGEHIHLIGDLSDHKADTEINAEGLLVLPGAVDTHVHFNDEFMNTVSVHDYYTGTLAAAFGGVTSIIDFSNQAPGEPLVNTVTRKKEEAEGKALVDWGVHPVITQPTEKTLNQIPLIVDAGAPTVKCYMTYRGEGLMMEDDHLRKILQGLQDAGGMLMLHAEDNNTIEKGVAAMIESGRTGSRYHAESRPPRAENMAIERAIAVARETGGRLFIVHMSTDTGMHMVASARGEGLEVFAETCTHYLVFTEEMLARSDGIKWICSPPLRSSAIQDALWEGLQDRRISMVTSDDAAYSWEAKEFGKDRFDQCPNGIPGIEARLSVLYSEGVEKGRISLPRFVELVSTAPAKMFGMGKQKGSLLPGYDADIVLFDPKRKWKMNQKTLHMASDWSAWDMDITGKILKVFSRGELIIDGDRCLATKGRGRYIHRSLDESFEEVI